jgi:formate dehydrogenase subunit gamma
MTPLDKRAAGELESGDALSPGPPVQVSRYTGATRFNHWITATCLVLLALSGLALFHPSLFFLSSLFGGGQWTRAIHPWIGVVLFFSFAGLFVRFWKANLPVREDGTWIARIIDVLRDHEERLPELGKYNAGQKFVFWSMSALIVVLIITGIVMWDTYFYDFTTIEQKRIAVLIHSVAAICAILVWILHVYAGIWVKGSVRAMTSGKVTGGWAWRHHRKWLRELVDKSAGRSARGPGAPAE